MVFFNPILFDNNPIDYNRVYTFDTETKDKLKGSELWKIALGSKKNYSVYDDVEDFISKLLRVNKQSVIYAHNLEFDIRFLLNHATFKKFIFYNRGVLVVYLKFDDSEDIFEFRDSYGILPLPQYVLAKSLQTKTQKYELDFERDDITNEEIEERIKTDVIGLYEILVKSNSFYRKRYKINLLKRLTIAKFSLDIFKSNYLKQKILNPYFSGKYPIWDLYYMSREAFFGSRVTLYDLNKQFDLVSYDINALYLNSMTKNLYPIGKIRQYNQPKNSMIENFGFSIVDLEVFENKTCLIPLRTKNGIYFPYGRIKGIYNNHYLKYLVENNLGKINEIKRSYIFADCDYIFKDFGNDIYNDRMVLQKTKNRFEILLKLVGNASYGKFGQKALRFVYEFLDNVDDYLDNHELYNIDTDYFVRKEKRQLSSFSMPHLSSYITDYSRITQYEFLNKFNPFIVYTDCDSFTIPSSIKINTSTKIGELKKEKSYKTFLALSPKAYIFENENSELKFMVKGFDKKERLFNILDFDELLKLVKKGYSYEKYASIKRMLRPNKDTRFIEKYLAIQKTKKSFPMMYEKRKIMKDLTTKPFSTKELGEFNLYEHKF